MPFGIIGRTGPGMRQVVGFGDRSTGRGTFGGDFGGSIVTNGDFTVYVCYSAATRPSSQITLGKLVFNTTANETDLQRKYYNYIILINLALSVLLIFSFLIIYAGIFSSRPNPFKVSRQCTEAASKSSNHIGHG